MDGQNSPLINPNSIGLIPLYHHYITIFGWFWLVKVPITATKRLVFQQHQRTLGALRQTHERRNLGRFLDGGRWRRWYHHFCGA
jgi:hypothetical protein